MITCSSQVVFCLLQCEKDLFKYFKLKCSLFKDEKSSVETTMISTDRFEFEGPLYYSNTKNTKVDIFKTKCH